MAKGSKFERSVCTDLSHWWSCDERDDLFWRTAGSGGRATVRGRRGKQTEGACGDIYSTHKSSRKLTRLITFELKRGYNRATLADVADASPQAKMQTFEDWFEQAELSANNGRTPFWALIHKRDRREAMIYFPHLLYLEFVAMGCLEDTPCISLRTENHYVVGMRLSDFYHEVSPTDVKAILRELKG